MGATVPLEGAAFTSKWYTEYAVVESIKRGALRGRCLQYSAFLSILPSSLRLPHSPSSMFARSAFAVAVVAAVASCGGEDA